MEILPISGRIHAGWQGGIMANLRMRADFAVAMWLRHMMSFEDMWLTVMAVKLDKP